MSDHIGCTRLRMIMLLHFCSTQGQLCPTWQSYAGLPPEEGACATCFPSRPNSIPVPAAPSGAPDPRSPIPAAPRLRALRARPLPPERSEHNPWHRGPEGPMDAIRPSAPKAQAPAGILGSTAPPTGIYCHLSHLLFSPRSFASLRMTVARRGSPVPIPT